MNSNFGPSTDFYEEIFEKELVSSIGTSTDVIEDYVIISVNFESKYPDEALPILKDKLEKLEIKEDTLKRRIRASIATIVLNYDSIEAINDDIQDDIIVYGKITDNLKDIYASITLEEVENVLKNITTKNMATIVMLPKEKVEE